MLPVSRVIGHKEWTNRKIDPLVDMNWRRQRVAAFQPRTMEDDMPDFMDPVRWTTPDGQDVIYPWATWMVWTNWHASQAAAFAKAALEQIAVLNAAVAALADQNDDVDTAAVLAHIDAAREDIRRTLEEGYELRLEPKGGSLPAGD